jgi:hypothetical protein
MSDYWNGIPEHPERDGWHYLQWADEPPILARWWVYNRDGDAKWFDDGIPLTSKWRYPLFFGPTSKWRYLSAVPTHDELTSLKATISCLLHDGDVLRSEYDRLIEVNAKMYNALQQAMKFIASEYKAPSEEVNGEWLAPCARPVYAALCDVVQTQSELGIENG